MSKKVAMILSGCGVFDGSEIHESVTALLALDRLGAQVDFFAPDIEQSDVVDHITGNTTAGSRHVLTEAARIARGNIKPITDAFIDDYDAAIFPGGSGAAKNLSNFALKHADCTVNPEVKSFIEGMQQAKKPMGFICIAPVIAAKVIGQGVELTIGDDQQTAALIEQMGAQHENCPVYECVVDEKFKVVTTPAYMLAKSIKEVAEGVEKCVQAVLQMA